MDATSDQRQTLKNLIREASDTEIGKKYGFNRISDHPTYAGRLPILFYQDLQPAIDRIKQGKADILWPGKTNKFAVSAGTTGEGKHLPLTDERLVADSRFMKSVIFSYLRQRPNIMRVAGKHLSLPGTVENHTDLFVGEISGFSALRSPFWLRPFQLTDPAKLVQLSFPEKFELLLHKSLDSNLKVISAVPSWILTLFQQVLQKTGEKSIGDVWPNLNLLVCGGVSLATYRPHLEKLMGDLQPDFIETYGASEGYFAYTDDLKRRDLKLVTDNGIFYEFIRDPLPDKESLGQQAVLPLWRVEPGVSYAMVVSTNAGLWRYALRDIIEFTSVNPPRILVKGRISEMLDDFGEGLYIYEAENALEQVLHRSGLQKSCFTVGGCLESEQKLPRHYWFIQFIDPVHTDTLGRLAKEIDKKLQEVNRHYAIRRESGALAAPVIQTLTQNEINNWFDFRNKGKAQSKLPRLLRNRKDIEFFLKI